MNAIFITVRTRSTRLHAKCLLTIVGKLAIEHVIERAKKTKADKVVLCTTAFYEDFVLVNIAEKHGILSHRGHMTDKLARWQRAAERFKVDFFVTFDGDDILCDPSLADLAFDQYEKTNADFIHAPNVPCGAFTYGIKVSALNTVCKIKGSEDTEMMVPYFTETNLFKCEELQNVPIVLQRPEIRMTLDYEDDLKFFRNIFDNLSEGFSLQDAIEYLDRNEEVRKINDYLQEKYLANQKNLTRMILKNEGSACSL